MSELSDFECVEDVGHLSTAADAPQANAKRLFEIANSIGDAFINLYNVYSPIDAKDVRGDGPMAEVPILQMSRIVHDQRRKRNEIFGDDSLFGEPAWDIILDLLANELAGKKSSVKSVCIGSCVPHTTALRWISILEQKGLIVREDDADDRRRTFIRFTPDGLTKATKAMGEMFKSIQSAM